jgi:hypothetical protein
LHNHKVEQHHTDQENRQRAGKFGELTDLHQLQWQKHNHHQSNWQKHAQA